MVADIVIVSKLIDTLEVTGEPKPWTLKVEFEMLYLGKLYKDEPFPVEIKVGAENGWLYGKYSVVAFDFINAADQVGVRYFISTRALKELAHEKLKDKKYSKTPEPGFLNKKDGTIVGWLDPADVEEWSKQDFVI